MNESRVAVAVRIRPLLGKEQVARCTSCVEVLSDTELLMGGDKQFTFDHVYSSAVEQAQVYEDSVSPLVENFVNGYNTTVLAYGQTGSGKTYTMGSGCGTVAEEANVGIIPRATAQVFDLIAQRRAASASSSPAGAAMSVEFYLRVQFLELYGENLRDLLDPVGTARGKVVSIRDGPNDSLQVVGATEDSVKGPQDMMDLLDRGTLCRTTGSTDMNSHSSRSHAIFTIILEQHLKPTPSDDSAAAAAAESTEYRISKFHFVDLAGSERAKRTRATGQRLKEGININMGLLALGNVISALGAEEAATMNRFVPYRDSKLTRMLQDSLGGNSRTLMIACVSPADSNFEETLNALRYANRARNIKNRAIINRDPKASQIAALKAQIAALKLQITQGGPTTAPPGGDDGDAYGAPPPPARAAASSSLPGASSSGAAGGGGVQRQRFLEAEVARLLDLYENERRTKGELQDRCFVLEAERAALLGLDAPEDDDDDDEDEDDGHHDNDGLLMDDDDDDAAASVDGVRRPRRSSQGGGGEAHKSSLGGGGGGDEDEDHDHELQQKFEKSQRHLRHIVNKFDETLKSKHDAMAQIVEERAKYEALRSHFESKMAEMNEEVRETQHQRDALEHKLRALESVEHSKQTDTSKSEALKLRTQLAEKDKRLRELEDRTRQLQEARKAAAEWQKKESVVRMEIEHFKREKVEYQRKLHENQKKYVDELKERRLEIAGLKRERARLEQDTNKLTQRTDRDLKLIQQKSEQVAAMQRKLREAQRLTFHPQALSEREKKQRVEIERLASLQVKREEELLDLRRALAKKEEAISRRDRLLVQLEKLRRHPIIVPAAAATPTAATAAASPHQVTIQQLVPEATAEDVRELEHRLEAANSEIIFRDLKCREVLEKDDDDAVLYTATSRQREEGGGAEEAGGEGALADPLTMVNFTSLDQAREVCQVLMQMFVESKRELRERKLELVKAHDQFLSQDQKVKIERRRTETLLGSVATSSTSPSSKRTMTATATTAASSMNLITTLAVAGDEEEDHDGGAAVPPLTPPPSSHTRGGAQGNDDDDDDVLHFPPPPCTPEQRSAERKVRDVLDSEVRIRSMEAKLQSLRVEDAVTSTKRRSSPGAPTTSATSSLGTTTVLPPAAAAATTVTRGGGVSRAGGGAGGGGGWVDRLTSPSNATGIHKYGKRTSQILPAIHNTVPHFSLSSAFSKDDDEAAEARRARRPMSSAVARHHHPDEGGGGGDLTTLVSPRTTTTTTTTTSLSNLLQPSGPPPPPPPPSSTATSSSSSQPPVQESSYMRMTESQRNKQQLDAEARKSSSLFHLRSTGFSARASPPPSSSSGRLSKAPSLPPFLMSNASSATVVPGKENANALLSKTLADERKRRRTRLTIATAGGGSSSSGTSTSAVDVTRASLGDEVGAVVPE